MIIDHYQRTEIRKKDQDLLKQAARDSEEIVTRKLDEIQKRYKEIEAKIIQLKDQKS